MTSVAQRLRQKLLDLAIHGKLVPQNPKDEPAGELLARIRRTRSAGGGRTQTSAAPLPIPEEEIPFDLPRSWVWCRLGDVILLLSGQDFPPARYNDKHLGTPYVTGASNFSNHGVIENRWTEHPSVISQRGDVLLTCKGAGVGKAVVMDLPRAHIARQIMALRPFEGVLGEYVYGFLRANFELLKGAANGLIPGIQRQVILNLPFPLPPLTEQERIVEKLNAMLNEVSRVAEGTERLAQLRKKARAKILDLAIRGKLVKQEKSDEPAAELLKRIAAEKAKLVAEKKIKKEKPLPPIAEDEIPFVLPKGWEWCRLAEIAYVAAGKTPAKTEFVEDGVPYIKMYNLRNQKIDFAFRKQFIKRETHDGKLAKSRLRPGDLLMNIVGPPLGKLAIIPDSISEANFNQAAVMIRPYVEAGIINQYLHYYLWQMDEINSIDTKGTAGQDNISITQSMMMRIALPPLAEQKRIVAKVKEMLAACDAFGGEG